MNAIDLIKTQHRQVSDLFARFEDADSDEKQALFEQIADMLAVHAKIEEEVFYPAMKRDKPDLILESLEEHLVVKRLIADLLAMDVDDDRFDAKMSVLMEAVKHHVEEEETGLLPKARSVCDAGELDTLGAEMEQIAGELLAEGAPREAVPGETEEAAPV